MYRIKVLLSLVVILSVTSVSIASNIIYVAANGPNDPGTGTSDDPFRRIQNAIGAANTGDVIKILPGVYTGQGNYDLDPNGKGITICSIDPEDPNTVASTIIDPNGDGNGFRFQSGEEANCVIWGLTIQNASGTIGGGISCQYSSPTINSCTIRNSSAMAYGGGGIFCWGGSPQIVRCIISGNLAYGGGGIECWFGQPTVENCIIVGNIALAFGDDGGGGIDCYDSNVVLRGCTIAGNLAPDGAGGGLRCADSNMKIESSIFWANSASGGTQLGLLGEGTASATYCDVQGGQTDVYDPCERLVWGSGNINSDPCFAALGYWDDNNTPGHTSDDFWVEGDYHLKSQAGRWDPNQNVWVYDAVTSLCIDAGDPNSDWSGEPWPNGKRINMGAYGGTGQASKNGNPADFNIDNSVDFSDFALMANQWLVEQTCIEDLNNDGKVNFVDISIFAENWLWEKK